MNEELIEKLKDKNYVRAFGLMSEEERECFQKVGKDRCISYTNIGWSSTPVVQFSQYVTYAIKPDYQTKLKQIPDMSIDEVWSETIRMWEFVCQQANPALRTEPHKHEWLLENDYEAMHWNCLFCAYAIRNGETIAPSDRNCPSCPIAQVDPKAHCCSIEYHYDNKPHKFLKKLKEWNAIRLSRKERKSEPEYVDLEIRQCKHWYGGAASRNLGVMYKNDFVVLYRLPSLPNFVCFVCFWYEHLSTKTVHIQIERVAGLLSEGKTVYVRFRKDSQ